MKLLKLPDKVKVLVVGSGGREAALVYLLAQSLRVIGLWIAPGNVLAALERLRSNGDFAQCVDIKATNVAAIVQFCLENGIHLVVIGPEAALFAGLADELRKHDIGVFGHSQAAAGLEQDKWEFQQRAAAAGVPVAPGDCFSDFDSALRYCAGYGFRVALKPRFANEGKGVTVHSDEETATVTLLEMMQGSCGEAGRQVVVQKRVYGFEASLHGIVNASPDARVCGPIVPFDSSMDHKPVYDDRHDPVGGGSAAISPHPHITKAQLARYSTDVFTPYENMLSGLDACGVVFPGIMVQEDGQAVVLEGNKRFGDPETQAYALRLKSDFMDIVDKALQGVLRPEDIEWHDVVAVCVVMMAKGYPDSSKVKQLKGTPIIGIERALQDPRVKLFGAGITRNSSGQFVVDGGRVIGVTALGETLEHASKIAYDTVRSLDPEPREGSWAHYRLKIGGR